MEARVSARLTLGGQLAVVVLNDAMAYRQTQARAAFAPVFRRKERVEQARRWAGGGPSLDHERDPIAIPTWFGALEEVSDCCQHLGVVSSYLNAQQLPFFTIPGEAVR